MSRDALKYLDVKTVAKDFPDKRSRAAIKAILEWFSHNSSCAWKLKDGTYDVAMISKGKVRHELTKVDAILMKDDVYEEARKVFDL